MADRGVPSRSFASSCRRTVRLWDAAGGAEELVLEGHGRGVLAAGYSADGARIVSVFHDGTVRVWDATSGAQLLVLEGHGGLVLAAGYSPDGARIVSGSSDGTVRVWDATSGSELLVLEGHGAGVYAAGFSPDGARIVSGSRDATVRVTWIGRSKQELIEAARAKLPRDLTEDERRLYYLAAE
jgi:WD40 repeat protein